MEKCIISPYPIENGASLLDWPSNASALENQGEDWFDYYHKVPHRKLIYRESQSISFVGLIIYQNGR